MKKILFFPGHSRAAYKYGLVGEVLLRLMEDKENDIYYLDCNNQIKSPCGLNRDMHWGYCNKCYKPCLKVAKTVGIKDDRILKIEKVRPIKFPKFKTIDEVLNYECEGYKLGLAPVSCTMTVRRDYDFDVNKNLKLLHSYLKTEYTILKNIERLNNIYHFDEFHIFNGRMSSSYPFISYAVKNKMNYCVYERASNMNSVRIIPNDVPHNFEYTKKEIKFTYEKDVPNKDELAVKFFLQHAGAGEETKASNIGVYTKAQQKDKLPKNFDSTKENIVIFNTSIDEVFAFESWKHPFAKNENEVFGNLFEHYKDDNDKHFYLRVHPNLKKAKRNRTRQMVEIEEFKKYRNVTVIEPDENIDSYAILKAADKVVVSYSTMGCEATFWGKPAILAGKATYEDTGCIYKAASYEELYKLIDTKDLQPKPKETAYPFGFHNQCYGEPYKYCSAKSQSECEIAGLRFKD